MIAAMSPDLGPWLTLAGVIVTILGGGYFTLRSSRIANKAQTDAAGLAHASITLTEANDRAKEATDRADGLQTRMDEMWNSQNTVNEANAASMRLLREEMAWRDEVINWQSQRLSQLLAAWPAPPPPPPPLAPEPPHRESRHA